MADTPKDETYSEEETVARREAALKVMLNTPKPRKRTGLSLMKAKAKAKAKP
jgi:hypothetical protein